MAVRGGGLCGVAGDYGVAGLPSLPVRGPLNLEMFYQDPTQHPHPSTGHKVTQPAGRQETARPFEAEEEKTNANRNPLVT